MANAFIIMQIGNEDLDRVCDEAIIPAVVDCDLNPRRVDRHNEGALLKSEIVRFINDAEIIIADLTNERPNVYLEVGYTMGVDKFRNLILTCREDHFPGRPGWSADGPKVHFDLSGYDILFWRADELEEFRQELGKRIRRRRARIQPGEATIQPAIDEAWTREQREIALQELRSLGFSTYMEIASGVFPPKPSSEPSELLRAAEAAQIHTFGWPIGVVLHKEGLRPKPRVDGIVAQIHATGMGESYDYWAIRRNGDFYTLKTIFEDKRDPDAIFFNTRIVRTAEAVLYTLRLYEQLDVDPTSNFQIQIAYSGLKGKRLGTSSARRVLSRRPTIEEDGLTTAFAGSLQEAEAEITKVVKQLVAPLFSLFDFYEFDDSVYESLVSDYLDNKVS